MLGHLVKTKSNHPNISNIHLFSSNYDSFILKQYCWMNIAAQHPRLLAHKTALEHSGVAEEGAAWSCLPFAYTSHTMESSTCPPFPNLLVSSPIQKQSPHIAHIICFSLMCFFSVGLIIPEALCCKVEIWHSAPSNFSNNEPLTSFMTTLGLFLTKIMGSL